MREASMRWRSPGSHPAFAAHLQVWWYDRAIAGSAVRATASAMESMPMRLTSAAPGSSAARRPAPAASRSRPSTSSGRVRPASAAARGRSHPAAVLDRDR